MSPPKEKTKQKQWYKIGKKKKRSEILTINDHGTEMVRSFKYLGTIVIRVNITNDETKEIKAEL